MKHLFCLLLVFAIGYCGAWAQSSTMRIVKTDGTTILIGVDEIDFVDFPEMYNLSLNTQRWCLHPDQQLHLQAFSRENGEDIQVKCDEWTTSNAAVARVDDHGIVTAVGEGTASITAKVGNEMGSMTVKVTTQKAFDLTISNVTNTSCDYAIRPNDPATRYYYNIRLAHGNEYSIDSMDDYGSEEENLFHFTRDWYDFVAQQYGDCTWNEVLQQQLESGERVGSSREFYNILQPGTEYKLFVIGFDADGYLSTPVEVAAFTTTAPQPSDITFDITIDKCLSTDAQFTVSPSNNDPYLVCVQRASYVEWFMERDRLNDMAQPMIENFALDSRYPALQQGTATLRCSDFVNVRSGEDYYVIVFGYNDGITSDVSVKHFRTEYGWTEPEGEIITANPPADLVAYDCTIDAFDVYADENDEVVAAPIETMYGEIGRVGNDVYLFGSLGAISMQWMKGTYDEATQMVTFASPQAMGEFDFYGQGAEKVYVVGGDKTTLGLCPLTFRYDAEKMSLRLDDNQYFVVNGKPFSFSIYMMMSDYVITLTHPL